MPATVLTIEDDALVRRSFCAYLADSGFRVLQAADGLEGLEVVRRERPDLVLTDLRMPGLDGLAVVAALRSESPDTPVIVVSGAGRLEDAIEAVRRGAWDYVTKPVPDLAALQLTVNRALERARLLAENRRHQEHLEQLVEERSVQLRAANADLQAALDQLQAAHRQLQTQHEALLAKDQALQQATDEIRRFNAELEQQVDDRTAELSARTAQLEATNQELEAFSYSVSHDLRGPLNRIANFGELLREDYADRLDAKGQHYLQRIAVACQHMAHLINDLLDLAHVARSELLRQRVDLATLAQGIVDDLRGSQPDRRVEFVCPSPLPVTADPNLMRVLLANLLQNAWKFTSKRPAARIEVGQVEHGGQPAYFVRDNGAGFDMESAGRLFGAFQRFHSAADFEGTGVGLATVQRIVHRHGGQVWAQSAVDQGTTIFFTLPA